MLLDLVQLMVLTCLPWLELRGSIPAGIAMGLDPFSVFVVCTGVNMLLVFPVFVFLDHVFPFVEHWRLSQWVLRGVRRKSHKLVQKYGPLGLALFVAVPLPGTGAYAGSLAAYVFGVDRRMAVNAVALGVLFAGVFVTLLSSGVFSLLL
ncbi:MAG: small multi-drug export protein [Candidatus Diapherotrites archaeon]|nr:small multi-drug export protein [Candidatus Diapherotrites archaeon]